MLSYTILSSTLKVKILYVLYNILSKTWHISSPEQRSWRAIVLPSAAALASTNDEAFVKVFKTSLSPNLIIDLSHLWYNYTYWSNFVQYHPHHLRSCQVHKLSIFMLKFYIKVFKLIIFFYLINKRKFRGAILYGDRSCCIYMYLIYHKYWVTVTSYRTVLKFQQSRF